MKTWHYAALAGVAFVVGLLLHAPAALVNAWLGPKGGSLQLFGLQGHLGEGRASGIGMNGRPTFGNLHWNLRPLWLLAGRLALDVDGGDEQAQLNGRLALVPGGRVRLSAFTVDGGLKPLAAAAGYPFVPMDGVAHLEIAQLALKRGLPQRAEGMLQIDRLAWSMARDPIVLGDFRAEVTTENDVILARLSSPSGPLDAAGELRLQPDGAYELQLQVRPKPEASAMVRNLLNTLGQPDPQGAFQVRRSGTLRPPAAAEPDEEAADDAIEEDVLLDAQ